MFSFFWLFNLIALAFAKCPPNSLHLDINDTVCYSFHSTLSKFIPAQEQCKSFGAQLVSLDSEYVNSYITGYANLIFDEAVFFWSGGNRLQNPSQLQWSNGANVEYTHFHKGDETKNGSCLAAEVKQGFWKNENCFAELSYVCQFLAGNNVTPDKADPLDFGSTTDGTTVEPHKTSAETTLLKSETVVYHSASTKQPETTVLPTNESKDSIQTTIGIIHSTIGIANSHSPSPTNQVIYTTSTLPETKIITTPNPITEVSQPFFDTCPQGYQYHAETHQCYKFSKAKLMWKDAEAYCQNEGAHLTSIENEAENKFIVEFVKQQHPENTCTDETDQPWIGFSRLENGVYFLWSEGIETNYTNWAVYHQEPNNVHGNQQCVEMFVTGECKFEIGSWNDYNCETNHTFVCRQPSKTVQENLCPLGWKYNSVTNYCYILNTELTTWEEAEAACQMKDAHLASVVDENENKFITDLINDGNSNNTCDTSFQTWIGSSKLADNTTWCWIDGSNSTYTKWADLYNEPNNLHGNQFCVQVISDLGCKFKSGDWNDIECNSTQKAVCKKPALKIVDPSAVPLINDAVENGTCPLGWEYNNSTEKCYKLNQNELNWADAEAACKKENAHLVTIEDKSENEFVVKLVQQYYDHSKCVRLYQPWIGFSRLIVDDNTTYHWASESTSNYTNWANRQPDDRKGLEACADLTTGSCMFRIGRWNDISCQDTRYYVCEKLAESFGGFSTTPKHGFVVENLTKS